VGFWGFGVMVELKEEEEEAAPVEDFGMADPIIDATVAAVSKDER